MSLSKTSDRFFPPSIISPTTHFLTNYELEEKGKTKFICPSTFLRSIPGKWVLPRASGLVWRRFLLTHFPWLDNKGRNISLIAYIPTFHEWRKLACWNCKINFSERKRKGKKAVSPLTFPDKCWLLQFCFLAKRSACYYTGRGWKVKLREGAWTERFCLPPFLPWIGRARREGGKSACCFGRKRRKSSFPLLLFLSRVSSSVIGSGCVGSFLRRDFSAKANYFRDSVSFVVLQFDFLFGGVVLYMQEDSLVPCAGGGKMSTLALQRWTLKSCLGNSPFCR